MAANNFYKTAVLRDGGLDNVDQRIVADIDAFAKEAAFLYGHSFKPILEFTLSLTEAAKELGYSGRSRCSARRSSSPRCCGRCRPRWAA